MISSSKLALVLLCAAPVIAQDLAIEGGTLFDGAGALRKDQTILIRGAKIHAMGAGIAVPRGARRIDARGKFLFPGLIDFHFHFNVRGDPRVSPWLPLHFLARGVTTLREMGNWIVEENQQWLAGVEARGLTAPRLLYSGPVLDGPNTLLPNQSLVLLDEMDARRVANRLIDEGATSLKVYSRLPLSLIQAVVEEAHRRGVPVHAHLGAVDPRDAIRAGLDGIEHTNMLCQALLPPRQAEAFRQAALREPDPRSIEAWTEIDPQGERATALIELMLRQRVNLDATLALHEPSPDTQGHEDRRKAFRKMAAFTVRYQRAGGSVTIGSHGTVPYAAPGFALHREMELHAKAGMSPAEVLQAATRVAAQALRLKDRGVIAPGMLADIVITDADPLEDIANAARVHRVILGGKVIDRAALLSAAPRMTGRP
jgi:imidazolonepropionase-like amidohydrolase